MFMEQTFYYPSFIKQTNDWCFWNKLSTFDVYITNVPVSDVYVTSVLLSDVYVYDVYMKQTFHYPMFMKQPSTTCSRVNNTPDHQH